MHPNQISKGKREFLAHADQGFGAAGSGNPPAEPVDVDSLYSPIGQLKAENEFLKKSLRKAGLRTSKTTD